MPPRTGRPTLATVAASAGVSVATVSKVVNGRSDVAPATRARVQSLLQEHHYRERRAESAGRAAPRLQSTVEVDFGGDLNAYSTEILHGILAAGATAGVTVAVSVRSPGHARSTADGLGAWAHNLAAAGRRAVIAVVDDLSAEDLAALSRARLPLVVIDPFSAPSTSVTSVGSTNFAGGFAATQHLLSLGHRRIGYVGGPPAAACNQARLHGFRAAMESHGAQVPAEYVRSGWFHYEDGVAEATVLLQLPDPPTAVFAGSDETAAGVIEAARRRGLRMPEDLSVVGFDDTKVALCVSPQLTTVRQPLREMGGVALRTALRLAAGEQLESHHVELATELVVRESTGPPSAGSTTDRT